MPRARARDEIDTRRLDGRARCPASVPRRCSSDAIYHPTARDSRRRPRGVDAPMATLGGGHALALSVASFRLDERARGLRDGRGSRHGRPRGVPPRGVRHRIPRDVALPRRGHAVRGLLGRGVEGAERRPRRGARRREPRDGDRRDGARARGGRARDHRARQVRDGGERIPNVASTGWARRGGSRGGGERAKGGGTRKNTVGPVQGPRADWSVPRDAHHAPPASLRAARVRARLRAHGARPAVGGRRHCRALAFGPRAEHHAGRVQGARQRRAEHELAGGCRRDRGVHALRGRRVRPPRRWRVRRADQQRLLRRARAAARLHPARPRARVARARARRPTCARSPRSCPWTRSSSSRTRRRRSTRTTRTP